MRALVIAIVLVLFASPAHAGDVGIVVTGDPTLEAPLAKQVDNWLRGHGHAVIEALSTDAVTSLLNCMQLDDQGCAQGVVAARSKTDAVLFGQAIKSRSSKATVLTLYWIFKDKEPLGMRRACEDCTEDLMRSTVEEMLGLITNVSSLARGRVTIHSKPEGMTVTVDNETIGVTPIDRELSAGTHQIVLRRNGQRVGERSLKVQADSAAEITIPVTAPVEEPDDEPRSRVVPGLILGVGGAAIAAGAVLFFTSEVDDGSKPTYRDTKPLGIGVAVGGVALASLGAYLFFRSGPRDHGPVASVSSQGGMIGWTGAF